MHQTITVSDLVSKVFTKPPMDACTFKLHLVNMTTVVNDKKTYNVQMFPYLMDIFINGAITLYGGGVTPQNMTNDQFTILKKYMLSLGHKVMNRYDQNSNGTTVVHIWFEPINMTIDCRGNVLYS
jgi:hypothetical protein